MRQFTGGYVPILLSSWLALCPSLTDTQGRCEVNTVEGIRDMDWKTLLAYVTGSVDEQLLLRSEYLVAENGILHSQIPGRN